MEFTPLGPCGCNYTTYDVWVGSVTLLITRLGLFVFFCDLYKSLKLPMHTQAREVTDTRFISWCVCVCVLEGSAAT